MGQLFHCGLQAGGVFDVEDADGAINLAEEAGEDFAGAYFDEDCDAGLDHFADGIEPADRAVTWRMSASRASSPVVMAWASTLVISGNFSALNCARAQVRFEALLRGHHQRAMEGRGNRQNDGALCATLRCDFDGALHGCGMSRK